MNSHPRVSVALITHNSEKYLSAQIDSILSNIGPDDEIVVSDDCSTDKTALILKQYASKDPRFHLYFSSEHLGANKNAEKAFSLCAGEFIFHSDDDNVWKPGKVETVLAVFKANPKVALVMHDATITDSDLKPVAPSFFAWRKSKPGVFHNIVRTSYGGSMMAFRSSFKPFVLPFPPEMPFFFDCWLGFMSDKHGKSLFIKDNLSFWRRHEGTASGGFNGASKGKKGRIRSRIGIASFLRKH